MQHPHCGSGNSEKTRKWKVRRILFIGRKMDTEQEANNSNSYVVAWKHKRPGFLPMKESIRVIFSRTGGSNGASVRPAHSSGAVVA